MPEQINPFTTALALGGAWLIILGIAAWHIRTMKPKKTEYKYPSAINTKLMSEELAVSTEQMN